MSLPETLRPSFWDCDFATLDPARDRDFIIGRILSAGPWDAIAWLRDAYGDATVRDWILRHRGRLLSSAQIRLWELLLDLPEADVTTWLKDPARRMWEAAGAS
ncbi:MAG: DUF6922 domain-containing protein [Planctomycetaceae bacterium]